ncbi:hypothetical protein BUALT_Bualt11G0021400 [Buddleja alternifolia]|uniref:RING-type E3 ubiquitin transferase n=1 Tax=Buddleja alternifolia TaxID=168488 RepID=A0AAV6X2P1_9LAMI|nr:hypothetical protein BUALT_Bualt11G0021400 [Buddleja alternifolia]
MALYHRKFMIAKSDKNPETVKKYSPCYLCYGCPDNCPIYGSSPPPPQPPPQKHQVPTTLIFMLCILGGAFLLLSYLTIGRYRSRRRSSGSATSLENGNFREDFIDENQGPVLDHPIWYIRTVGLPQSVIDSIAVFRYKDGEGLIEGKDCSVCLNEFEEDESLRLLPKCSHAFHLPCIDTWLRSHKNCPLCRAPVLVNTDTVTARVDPVETNTMGSGLGEEDRAVINESETGETLETRCIVENRSVMLLKDKFRVLSDLADHHRIPVDRDLQPVRRSFSMDFSSASMICTKKDEGSSGGIKMAIVEKHDFEVLTERGSRKPRICNRLIKSSSHGCSVQKWHVPVKRSFSFSGKRCLRKHSRSLESITVPEIREGEKDDLDEWVNTRGKMKIDPKTFGDSNNPCPRQEQSRSSAESFGKDSVSVTKVTPPDGYGPWMIAQSRARKPARSGPNTQDYGKGATEGNNTSYGKVNKGDNFGNDFRKPQPNNKGNNEDIPNKNKESSNGYTTNFNRTGSTTKNNKGKTPIGSRFNVLGELMQMDYLDTEINQTEKEDAMESNLDQGNNLEMAHPSGPTTKRSDAMLDITN